MYRLSPFRLFRRWSLVFAIVAGALSYFLMSSLPLPPVCRRAVLRAIPIVQPILLFLMLFLSYSRVSLRALRPRRSHLPLLAVQVGGLTVFSLLPAIFGWQGDALLYAETALLCLICPTATASTVVTTKLGGDAGDVVSYTFLIGLTASFLLPVFLPLLPRTPDMPVSDQTTFMSMLVAIAYHAFPVLVLPLITTALVRRFIPWLHSLVTTHSQAAFLLWLVSLSLAIAVTTRSLVHAPISLITAAGMALVSLACCALQFALGSWVGRRCGRRVSTAQALGQKNTVFIIWLGYTFLHPVSALAGGFYSVWHNLYNAYQLQREAKVREQK